MDLKEEIEMAARHVRQGEGHISRQHAIIAELKVAGADTGLAEELLLILENSQAMHMQHLARLSEA